MMIADAVEPFQQHHLLSKCAEAVREASKRWITNRPRRHCYPGSGIEMVSIHVSSGSNVRKTCRKVVKYKVDQFEPQLHGL